jgi:hypothetical protein
MSLTDLANLMLNDLFQANFLVWAEWKFPHDERSPLTSVKKQNFDSEQLGNQGPQTAIKTVNTVTAVHNRLLCC